MKGKLIIKDNLNEIIFRIKKTNQLIGNPKKLDNISHISLELESLHETICIITEILNHINENKVLKDNSMIINYLNKSLEKLLEHENTLINKLNKEIEGTTMMPQAYYDLIDNNNNNLTNRRIINRAIEQKIVIDKKKSEEENIKDIITQKSFKVITSNNNQELFPYCVTNGYQYDKEGNRTTIISHELGIVEAGLHNVKREVLLKLRKLFNEISKINKSSIDEYEKAITILEIIRRIKNEYSLELIGYQNVSAQIWYDLMHIIEEDTKKFMKEKYYKTKKLIKSE